MNQAEIDQFEIELSEENNKEWEEVKKWLEIMDFKIFYWESEELWEKNPAQMQMKIGRWLKRVLKGVNKLRNHF